MCNLSQGIKEQGIEQGLEQGRKSEIFTSVQEGDYGIERGAQKMNLSVEEFTKQMTSQDIKYRLILNQKSNSNAIDRGVRLFR